MTMEEGPRLKHLRQALHKMIQATIKSCGGVDNTEQCFPFGLENAQLQQVDEQLTRELHTVYADIQGPFEELIKEKGLAGKLNEIDTFLKTRHQDDTITFMVKGGEMTPKDALQVVLRPSQEKVYNELRSRVEQLEWQTRQRREELGSRVESLERRQQHVTDSQKLYDETIMKVLNAASTGADETLVDRMQHHHQTVPHL